MAAAAKAADNNNQPGFFGRIDSFTSQLSGLLKNTSIGVIILCFSITGLMFIFGEGPSRTAKKWLTYIVIGALIIFGAAALSETLKTVGGFN